MNRLALFLIGLATPRIDRESVLGDTIERVNQIRAAEGDASARRWLRRETWRVLIQVPRHRLAVPPARGHTLPPERSDVMSSIWQDGRYAVRWFARSPGFTAVAVLTLALGMGANTAMFSVVNAVLLKPLPFANADHLMLAHLLVPQEDGGIREVVWSYPKYKTFLEIQRVFDDTALFTTSVSSLSGDGDPERLQTEIITERYLSVLGISPILGRTFTADEAHRPGATPVALIGHGLWTRRYGGDASVVGRAIQIGRVAHTVVGVLPAGFNGLNGNTDAWTPLAVSHAQYLQWRQSHSYYLVARRKPDVSEAAAIAAVRTYGGQIDDANREGRQPEGPWGATARSLHDSRLDADLRRASLVVLGAVGFVLLIACVNLTNLLVAKVVARHREVAIRVALGAGRGRLLRQFGIESLLLSVLGAAGGLAVATLLLGAATMVLPDSEVLLRSAIAPGTPRMSGAAGLTRVGAGLIGLDGWTLAFTAALTVGTAMLVSILPAFRTSAIRPSEALKTMGVASTGRGHRGFGSRGALVAIEIAMALVLLVGAGLMLKSVSRLHQTRLGIDPGDVLTFGINLPGASYTQETGRAFYADLLGRIQSMPGVESAGWGNCVPASGGCNGTGIGFFPPRPDSGRGPIVGIYWATAGYFEALRIPLLEGRMFSQRDRADQPKVALVNEAAARAFWPNETAIGKRIALGQGGFHEPPGAEVIGIVGNVRYRSLEAAADPDVYVPLTQSYQPGGRLFIRSRLDTRALAPAVARETRSLDPNLPLTNLRTMDEFVGNAMWRTRVAAWLLSAFAALALLLTAIGVFAVMAQTVAQRTAEIGIRMALGADRREVFRLVLGRAMVVTGVGVVVGVAAAMALTRVLTTLLYEVRPTDPSTFGIVAAIIGFVALVACYVPARRATRVDAVTALRSE